MPALHSVLFHFTVNVTENLPAFPVFGFLFLFFCLFARPFIWLLVFYFPRLKSLSPSTRCGSNRFKRNVNFEVKVCKCLFVNRDEIENKH